MISRYQFGRIEVRADERRVLIDGKPAALGARALDLLLCLIERRDRVVGKDELLELVWPGVVVEENNLTVQISHLRRLLGQEAVSTVAGRGYRFTLTSSGSDALSKGAVPAAALRPGEIDLSLPDKPSIAVLPFVNLSGDLEQEYFTDGVTEDIITDLSRFHSLFVIARNSSFTYKGRAVDIKQIGRELGVRYVLEGSIRKASGRIRVAAQLVDALADKHIWAERYDRILEDVFMLQEDVTRSIVTAIAPQIDTAERNLALRRRPESLSAYEIAVHAAALAWDAYQKQDRAIRDEAIAKAKAALAVDPRSTLALSALAYAQWQHFMYRTASDLRNAWEESLAASSKAVDLDPSDSRGYTWKGLLLVFARDGDRWDEALSDLRRAHELNPNDVNALSHLGWSESAAGDPESGLVHLHQALRISPRDPTKYSTYHLLGQSYFLAKNYARAIEYCLAGASEASNFPHFYMTLAVAYVGAGQLESAREALRRALHIAPEWIQSRLEGGVVFRKPEHWKRFTTFLRTAADLKPLRLERRPRW